MSWTCRRFAFVGRRAHPAPLRGATFSRGREKGPPLLFKLLKLNQTAPLLLPQVGEGGEPKA